jgi:CRISPR-associated protein (TIGR02584 family)
MPPKHTLIAVTGMTPQVVTETLYGLMVQKKIPISEVFVITTAEGKAALMGELRVQLPPLVNEIQRMCAQYLLRQPAFDPARHVLVAREESVELHDIRSDRENQLFPNLITDFIRTKASEPDTVLHCSITGGRKTMSVAMASALSLFGRKDDVMYHVLVSKAFEDSKKFFPENEEESRQLVIAQVPYLHLLEKLPLLREYPRASFSELVSIAQGEIDQLLNLPRLIFDRSSRTVLVGSQRIRMKPFPFAFYLFCAKQRKPLNAGKRFGARNWNRLWNLYEQIAPAYGHKERVKRSMAGNGRAELLMKAASTVRRTLRQTLGEGLARYYAVTTVGEYRQARYTILLDRSKISFD